MVEAGASFAPDSKFTVRSLGNEFCEFVTVHLLNWQLLVTTRSDLS
jgi:hypothetical protein